MPLKPYREQKAAFEANSKNATGGRTGRFRFFSAKK